MDASTSVRLAVFGYGSLVSRISAGQTLGRPVASVHPARLGGWSRAWTLVRDNRASEKTFARPDGSLPTHCLGLNLDPSAGLQSPNGALIELTAAELERLDVREMRYRRVDVSTQVETRDQATTPSFDRVYAYTAKPAHRGLAAPRDAILIAAYLRTVEAAFAELGQDELELFRATTEAPGAPVVEANLVDGERIPPGNPRDW